jgi:poly(3-hydroxybutyrate) depolymerase
VHHYLLYDISHAALTPWRAMTEATKLCFDNPFNPVTYTAFGRSVTAACELFERTTRRYQKPTFGLSSTVIDGKAVRINEEVVWAWPFCNLLHFRKELHQLQPEPRLLIVAPMSGHYATLLRGTVEAMLPRCDVYISDWVDASMVPTVAGSFDLDDYIDYVINMLHALGPDTHVMAVCQPSVPVLAAVALMEEDQDAFAPRSMTLMGGPIDTRVNPTAVSRLAIERGTDWFRGNAIMPVPFGHLGFGRDVYPGFLQLSGFMSLNMDRHVTAHWDLYKHLVQGDGDSAEKHREFYDEYLAVMDLTAEFYLQTIDTVFVRHALPRGEMTYRGRKVDLSSIRRVALMTVEGEKDDISGVGQTEAAHRLCSRIPSSMRVHYVQPNVGHYGVFNGSRFAAEIAPRIHAFVRDQETNRSCWRVPGCQQRYNLGAYRLRTAGQFRPVSRQQASAIEWLTCKERGRSLFGADPPTSTIVECYSSASCSSEAS